MLIPHGTVVALVDGKNFELYRNSGNEAEPQLEAIDAPRFDVRSHSGGGHHSSSANPSGHLADEDAHANAVTQWLNSQVLGHKIDQLIVIAAPRTLGEMRHHYHKMLDSAIVAELAKDLNGRPLGDILSALRSQK